jgi:hypothetical protein
MLLQGAPPPPRGEWVCTCPPGVPAPTFLPDDSGAVPSTPAQTPQSTGANPFPRDPSTTPAPTPEMTVPSTLWQTLLDPRPKGEEGPPSPPARAIGFGSLFNFVASIFRFKQGLFHGVNGRRLVERNTAMSVQRRQVPTGLLPFLSVRMYNILLYCFRPPFTWMTQV